MPGLYGITGNANVAVANTPGLYINSGASPIISNAQQLLDLLSNNGTVYFQLDPATGYSQVEAFVSNVGGPSGNLSLRLVGDVTGFGFVGNSITTTLSNTAVTAGTYGSNSLIPVITVDAKGRVESVTVSNVATYLPGDPTIASIISNVAILQSEVYGNTQLAAYLLGSIYTGTINNQNNIINQGSLTNYGNINNAGSVNSANVVVSNGIFWSNGTPFASSNYGNSNVAAYMPGYLSTYTGNLSAGNLTVSGNLNLAGNVFFTNINTIVTTTIIANSTTPSTSTGTGAIITYGGLGVAGNVWAADVYSNGFFFANGSGYFNQAATAAYLAGNTDPTISNLNANAAVQATQINTLFSNAAVQQTEINSIISGINANVVTALKSINPVIIGLGANAYPTGTGVSIGENAGNGLNTNSVYIGQGAGNAAVSGGGSAVAIGQQAGGQIQSQSVAIGTFAQESGSSEYSVAIGYAAGQTNQGGGAVAIGQYAGQTNQASESIALNASEAALNPSTSGFFVSPVRSIGTGLTSLNLAFYNTSTNEFTSYGSEQALSSLLPAYTNTINAASVNIFGNATQSYGILNIGSSLGTTNTLTVYPQTSGAIAYFTYANGVSNTTGTLTFSSQVSVSGNASLGNYATIGQGINLTQGNIVLQALSSVGGWVIGSAANIGNVYSNNTISGKVYSNNYLFANGVSILTTINYGNTQVAAYLASNTDPTISNLNANAAAQAVALNTLNANVGAFETYANITFGTSNYGNSNVATYLPTYAGNVGSQGSTAYFLGNAASLTGNLLVGTPGGTSVKITPGSIAASNSTLFINGITNYGALQTGQINNAGSGINIGTSGDSVFVGTQFANGVSTEISGSPVLIYGCGSSGEPSVSIWSTHSNGDPIGTGNIDIKSKYITFNNANFIVGNVITSTANISTTQYFTGNGYYLTGITAGSTYGNANVAAYLPIYNGNIEAANVNISQFITLSTPNNPTYAKGLMWYDSIQDSVSYYNSVTNNEVNVGQETQFRAYNNTGSTIVQGAPVYINGAFGSWPNIALAQGNTLASAQVAGVANQAIPAGSYGYVVSSGTVANILLVSYQAGDSLYLSSTTPGVLQNYPPATGYVTRVGYVSYNGAQGRFITSITNPINNQQFGNLTVTGNLNGNNATITNLTTSGNTNTTGTTTTGNLITTSGVYWANGAPYSAGGSSGVSQIIAGTGISISPVGGTGVVTITNTGGGSGSYGNANVAAYLPTYTGDIGSFLYPAGTGYFTSVGGTLTTAAQPNITSITGYNYNNAGATTITGVGSVDIQASSGAGGIIVLGDTSDTTEVGINGYLNIVGGDPNGNAVIANNGNIIVKPGYYFVGDGSQLVNLPAQPSTYSNTNVAAYLTTASLGSTYAANTIVQGTQVFIGGSSEVLVPTSQFQVKSDTIQLLPSTSPNYNPGVAFVTIASDTNVNGGNLTARAQSNDSINYFGGNIIAIGTNGVGGYFVGNGAFLTGIVSSYGNANVAAYLTSGATGVTANLGNIVTTSGVFWANGVSYSSFSGNLAGKVLYDSVNQRVFANAYPLSTPTLGSSYKGSLSNNTFTYAPVYVNGVLAAPTSQTANQTQNSIAVGFVQSANVSYTGSGQTSQNRITTGAVLYSGFWPQTGNAFTLQDRVYGSRQYLDMFMSGQTYGPMVANTATAGASTIGAAGPQTTINGFGNVSSVIGVGGSIQVVPAGAATANVLYATGSFSNITFNSINGGTATANIQYARLFSGCVASFSSSLTCLNAIGLHTFSGWAGTIGTASAGAQRAYSVLNEDSSTLIQTNGNIVINNTATTGYMQLGVFTVAQLAATGVAGQIVAVSNGSTGGQTGGSLAYWDTTNNQWSWVSSPGTKVA